MINLLAIKYELFTVFLNAGPNHVLTSILKKIKDEKQNPHKKLKNTKEEKKFIKSWRQVSEYIKSYKF